MTFDQRSFAVATAGFAAFVNLYSPQALLPELANEFHVGPGEISALMTAGTAAIALSAPFTGALADVAGRKRLIAAAMFAVVVPTLIMTFAGNVPQLTVWRFVQGLLLPPIFTVAVAYIGDEWPPADVARVAGIYISGSAIGGFCGRFIPGLLTDIIGWRAAIAVVAALTLFAAIIVTTMLPRERNFVRSGGVVTSIAQMVRHLRNRRLVATYAIGFGVLFNFVATFTYVNFHLAAPPYQFSPTLLGALFLTYLVSSPIVPWVGRAIAMFGRRQFVLGVIALWIVGALLLLAPPVALIVAGLTLCAVCGMVCQAVSTGYVTLSAKEGRSSAVGLYASIYYIGGSAGAFITGLAWASAGWSGCVAVIVVVQLIIALIVATAWD
ncbi:MAG TPA: MFS transporter [Xanthobacteraceae bacterium]|jgi:YNFM family putative membrane transporter|nr:MFS transporter [Xanthobacteraceae bacterium]